MCTFVTIGVARASGVAFEQALRRTVNLSRDVNRGIARLFPGSDALFVLTVGGCSCGLDLVPRPAQEDPRRKRLQRRGYSEARIARVLGEARPSRGDRPEVVALRAVLARFGPVRFCVQTVRGGMLTEPVPCDLSVSVWSG